MSAERHKSVEGMLHHMVIQNIARREQSRASIASTNWRAPTSGESDRRILDVGDTNNELRSGHSDSLAPLTRHRLAPQHADPQSPSRDLPFLRTATCPAIRIAPAQMNVGPEPLREPFGAVTVDHPIFRDENFQHVRNRIRRITATNRIRDIEFSPQQMLQANQPTLSYSQVAATWASRAAGHLENRAFEGPFSASWRSSNCNSSSAISPSAQLPKPLATSFNSPPPELITMSGNRIDPARAEKMMALMTKDASYSEQPQFQPNRMVLEKRGLVEKAEEYPSKDHRYRGDLDSGSFLRQIDDLPDDLNAALWIKNLAPNATYPEVFKKITVGAVYALHIFDNDDLNNTKAIKLVFMKTQAAAAFLWQTRGTGVWIRGRRLEAVPNRHGYRENATNQSRVLVVEGPTEIMAFTRWDEYFRKKAELQWEGHRTISTDGKRTTMEFRFARVDGQSQTCLQAILSEPRWKDGSVTVEYGPDPCDPANPQVHLSGN